MNNLVIVMLLIILLLIGVGSIKNKYIFMTCLGIAI
ncbi:hypothetical protein BX659_10667 [Orenia metallireducens]|uniref:Uncharacterized protein n=1 Tax=Orenia metallireducens TaxID=1413210 RepID=A0A285GXF7_9FIRM|nr:hypothetical protein BX659_10667 [Orenia metallireducens]SNY27984.1 hypothetical protein SAMN06265827_111121 [Orenia metallireducens]